MMLDKKLLLTLRTKEIKDKLQKYTPIPYNRIARVLKTRFYSKIDHIYIKKEE